MAEYRIDQATPGLGVPNIARHDLVPGEIITLTAITPAPGAGVTYTWEIIDKVGSTATLSATTGTTVTIGPAIEIDQPCSFKVRLTANDNGAITIVERVFGVPTVNLGLRIPLFAETSPPEATLTTNTPNDSVDNAVYVNRAGLGVNDQNWRGWAEWAYRMTTLLDAAVSGSTFGLFHFTVNGGIAGIGTPTDFLDGLREAGVNGTIASVHMTQEIDGGASSTSIELYKVDTLGVETSILTAPLSILFGGGAKVRVLTTGFDDDQVLATDRLGIKLTGVQTAPAADVTVTVVLAGNSLSPPAGLPEDNEVTHALNGTVLGTTFELVGSVYLPAGTIDSTLSRVMLGTDQVADTAVFELRRFTGGAPLGSIAAIGVLQDAQFVSDVVVPADDWYDLYLNSNQPATNALLRGLKLVYTSGLGSRIRQAFDQEQTGVTPLLVGSVYLPGGTLQAGSRTMMGTSAGGTATVELRRFTGGAVITTWAATGALQEDSLGAPVLIPASDWYDIYIYGDAGPTIALVKGLDWVVLT